MKKTLLAIGIVALFIGTVVIPVGASVYTQEPKTVEKNNSLGGPDYEFVMAHIELKGKGSMWYDDSGILIKFPKRNLAFYSSRLLSVLGDPRLIYWHESGDLVITPKLPKGEPITLTDRGVIQVNRLFWGWITPDLEGETEVLAGTGVYVRIWKQSG